MIANATLALARFAVAVRDVETVEVASSARELSASRETSTIVPGNRLLLAQRAAQESNLPSVGQPRLTGLEHP
jgi:hypothetical protein